MSYRVSEKELNAIVAHLNKITGNASAPYTKNADGKIVANIGNYHLYYAYGGVSLVQMVSDGGGIRDVSTGGKVTKSALATWIRAYIAGIEAGKAA